MRAAPEATAGAAKLVCTAGPKAGEEYGLDGPEVVIGRATDVAVSIPDTSVSRRHARVRKVGQGWAVSDLGSGNGTLVNGEPVDEERVLRNGDVLSCGDTELSFVDQGNATDRRPVPRRTVSSPDAPVRRVATTGRPRVARAGVPDPEKEKRKKKLLLIGGAVLLVILTSMGALKYRQMLAAEKEQKAAAEIEDIRAQIAAIFQDGKNLVRQGKWDEAKVRFEQIKEAAPNYPGVQDYLDRAEKEIPNQHALAAAQQALDANQVAAASEALKKVSQDTQQFELVQKLRAALESKVLDRVKEAEAIAIAAGRLTDKPAAIAEFQKVVAISTDILTEFPDNRDANVLKQSAASRIAELSYVAPPPPKATPKPWEDATRQFIDGDITGAFAIANNCAARYRQCKEKVALMQQFNDKYKALEDLDAKGLSALLALNDKITGGRPSKFSRNAGTRAANIYFKSASAAKAAGQWGRALDWAQRALAVDPGHAGAVQIVTELRSKAKDVYLLGYSIKDTNPEEAVVKFKEVMLMAPPSDEWHQKAKRRIEELGK